MNGHKLDMRTECCLRCGQMAITVVDEGVHCASADNVIPVTHLLFERKMRQLIDTENNRDG